MNWIFAAAITFLVALGLIAWDSGDSSTVGSIALLCSIAFALQGTYSILNNRKKPKSLIPTSQEESQSESSTADENSQAGKPRTTKAQASPPWNSKRSLTDEFVYEWAKIGRESNSTSEEWLIKIGYSFMLFWALIIVLAIPFMIFIAVFK